MAPKAAKGNPEVLVHEDVYTRAMRIKDAQIKAPKPPKGDLTEEEMVWPPSIQQLPEIKAAVHYFTDAQTIRFGERHAMKWPTDTTVPLPDVPPTMVKSASDTELIRKGKKDVQDAIKILKGQSKLHTKQSAKFFKQFEKSETKQGKREVIVQQIADAERVIDQELRNADEYAKKTRLFARRFVYGSKLGQTCPKNNVAVVGELSDKMAPYHENANTDLFKFFGHVVEKHLDGCFHFSLFHHGGVIQHGKVAGFQLTNSKTGAADAMKWMGKQFTPKAMLANPWPPNWEAMFDQFSSPEMLPSHIYLVCSKVPVPCSGEDKLREIRAAAGVDIPVTIISYEPEVAGDFTQESFFKNIAGEEGEFMIDTSKADMEVIDKALADVKKKRKQLEKLEKKLAKLDDLGEVVETNRRLFRQQSSLEKLVKNDLTLAEQALKRPAA